MTLPAEIHEAQQRVKPAYDPALWQTLGHTLIDLLADHLRTIEDGRDKVLRWRDPPQNVAEAAAWMEQSPGLAASGEALADRFAQLVRITLERGLNLHDPRYIGHQVAASVPLAGLFDAVGLGHEPGHGDLRHGALGDGRRMGHGPASWAADRLAGRPVRRTGDPRRVAGEPHGPADRPQRDLARLLAAGRCPRRPAAGAGGPRRRPLQRVARAAGILGLGTGKVLRVGLDARRRMDVAQLERRWPPSGPGPPIVAVVACACSTPVGAFDPLEEVADVCRRHGVWLHVDAAHGGAACLSPRHRHLVAGLDRADSLVWDAHKMLFVPALCAFVFYRQAAHGFEAFRQDAPYLFDPAAPGLAEFDSGLRTVECTKRAAAFGLWGLWSLVRPAALRRPGRHHLRDGPALLREARGGGRLRAPRTSRSATSWSSATCPGRCVTRRRRCWGDSSWSSAAGSSSRASSTSSPTKLDGIGALRVTIINPLTTPEHLDQLLDAIRRAGKELLRAS